VISNGQIIEGHCLLAIASNIRMYAGGLARISPAAQLDDGWMDLWLFQGETLGDTVQCALRLLTGRHVSSAQVKRVVFQQADITSSTPIFAEVDGEPVEIPSKLRLGVKPKILRILVPAYSPSSLFTEQETSPISERE
jgi:diacylglycerol kinase family enzyme